MLEFLRGKRVFGAPFRTTQTSQQRKTESRLRASRKREGPLHPGRFSPLLVFSSFLFETKTVSRCVNLGLSRGNGWTSRPNKRAKGRKRERGKKKSTAGMSRWKLRLQRDRETPALLLLPPKCDDDPPHPRSHKHLSLSSSLPRNKNLENRHKLPTEPEDSQSTTAATVREVFFSKNKKRKKGKSMSSSSNERDVRNTPTSSEDYHHHQVPQSVIAAVSCNGSFRREKKPEPGTGGEWGAPGTRAGGRAGGGGGRGHNATGKIRLSSIPLQLAIVGRQRSYLSTVSTGKVTSKLLKVYLPLGCRDGKVTSNW